MIFRRKNKNILQITIIKLSSFTDDEVLSFKSFKAPVGGWGLESTLGTERIGMIWMRFQRSQRPWGWMVKDA